MKNYLKMTFTNRARRFTCCCLPVFLFIHFSTAQTPVKMSQNKETILRYIDGFTTSDHAKILSCLTEDIIWEMPGIYNHSGKTAFDKEIENPAFTGSPTIRLTRLLEESDVIVAEGTVQCKRKEGGKLDAVFCDVFIMERGKIKKLTSYMMNAFPSKQP